jgi:L-amino acid N-acyltransferase YncA
MKIIIRKAKKGDARGIVDSFNEGIKTGFNLHTGNNSFMDKQKIKKMDHEFSEKSKHSCSIVAVDQETGKIVGSAVFHGRDKGRLNHRLELIATKMVLELIKEAKKRGFKKIQAEVCVENISSVKFAKKMGFEVEGKRKKGMHLDNGKYVDTYIFGRIL